MNINITPIFDILYKHLSMPADSLTKQQQQKASTLDIRTRQYVRTQNAHKDQTIIQ